MNMSVDKFVEYIFDHKAYLLATFFMQLLACAACWFIGFRAGMRERRGGAKH